MVDLFEDGGITNNISRQMPKMENNGGKSFS
jgi:hypothetical protein